MGYQEDEDGQRGGWAAVRAGRHSPGLCTDRHVRLPFLRQPAGMGIVQGLLRPSAVQTPALWRRC